MTEAEGQTHARHVRGSGACPAQRTDQPEPPRTYYTEALAEYLLNRSNILGDTYQPSATRRCTAAGCGSTRRSTRTCRAGRGGPRRPPRHAAGLRRRDRVAGHPDRRDRGDGRRPRVRPGENEVNMALAPRQTGSSQKMFILAAALQAGRPPRTSSTAAAVRPAQPGRPERSVRDHRRGEPRAGHAAGDDVGVDQLRLRPAGPDRRAEPGRQHDLPDGRVAVPVPGPAGDGPRAAAAVPGSATGGNEMSPLDMASGAQTIANEGVHNEPYYVEYST